MSDTDMVTLICPPGAADYPISHNTVDYQPDVYRADHTHRGSERHVTVPRHVAESLLHTGGFALAKMNIGPLSSGESVRLVDKHGVARDCGWNGVNYPADEDGVVTVPMEAVAELTEGHEFVPAPPKAEPIVELHATAEPSSELQQIRVAVTEARADLADFDEKNPDAKGRAEAVQNKAGKAAKA